MVTLHIIEVDSGLEAQAIRAVAEAWGATVAVTWVGNSGQIVDVLSGQPADDLLMLTGHGDERGLLLPALAEEVRSHYPYHGVIRPEDFAQFVHLAGNIVINTCCWGGGRSLADVFLQHGAQCYIGPTDALEGDAALMYTLEFLYTYLHNGYHIQEAHQAASHHGDDRHLFTLYRSASSD